MTLTAGVAEPRGAGALPAWVLTDPGWQRLRPGPRGTLVAVAAVAQADLRGNLLVIGGQELRADAGVARATFKRHLRELVRYGFMVRLTSGFSRQGATWGIPAAREALAGHQWPGPMWCPRVGEDGRRQFGRVGPGEQARLLDDEQTPPAIPANGRGLKLSPQVDQTEPPGGSKWTTSPPPTPPPMGLENPIPKPDGVGVASRPSKTGRPRSGLGRVHEADLSDDGRLQELWARAIAAGLVESSEADRLRIWGAAEHALRVGRDPGALFAYLVRGRRWLLIDQADEDAAARRLAMVDRYGEREETHAEEPSTAEAGPGGTPGFVPVAASFSPSMADRQRREIAVAANVAAARRAEEAANVEAIEALEPAVREQLLEQARAKVGKLVPDAGQRDWRTSCLIRASMAGMMKK